MTDQELVERAFTMLERSYVPYSHFPVGAALEVGGWGGLHRLQRGKRRLRLHDLRRAHRAGEGRQRGLPEIHPAWPWWATARTTAGPAGPAARCCMSSPQS